MHTYIHTYLPCQDKTPYIQNAIFSGEGIENLKKVSYCILLTIHISYLKNISYVVFLHIFSNDTVFFGKNVKLLKLRTKNCFNVAVLTSILPNYNIKTPNIRIFGLPALESPL